MSRRSGERKINSPETLDQFARGIEQKLLRSGEHNTLQRLICRHLTGKDAKVASYLLNKVVEWRFGKAKETISVTGTITHEHFDATRLSDEQLAIAEQLIESAHVGGDKE